MEDREKALEALHNQIEELQRRHKQFHQEIEKLQNAIFEFQVSDMPKAAAKPVIEQKIEPKKETAVPPVITAPPVRETKTQQPPIRSTVKKEKTAWEDFIGTNLLNKIGIAVLVVGIGFGAKYSIDHELINPLTRIILGYLAGVALIVLAIRLKKAHDNFSAVLLSGGMAVLYFITFAAYDFYQLIPQTMAFVLMVMFTGFTVFAAIQYDKQVIGIIGLVGAYAVPILLSDGSGKVVILFSYITIINTGILILAFKKYWKVLYYIAFILTWATFASWFTLDFNTENHFWISLIFSTIFFVTFYITFLAYKLLRKEPLHMWDVVFMLLNSFLYFGYGYATIDYHPEGDGFLGLFTVFTALIHFTACVIIYKQQEQYKDIFYFVAGLVLVFLTIAVPVQLEGNWVTLVWALEAALLFWIGRTKTFPVYEKLSYPLILLSFGSLLHDWNNTYINDFYYNDLNEFYLKLFLNIQFLTTLLVTASLGFILWLSRRPAYTPAFKAESIGHRIFYYGLPLIMLFILYAGIYKEVETFWSQRFAASGVSLRSEYGDNYTQYDYDLNSFKSLWLIIYSAIFAIVLSVIQLKFIRNKQLSYLSLAVNTVVILAFITIGLLELSRLRSSYITQDLAQYFYRDAGHILIRYAGLAVVAPLLWINYLYLNRSALHENVKQGERLFFHFIVIALLSSELIHWLELAHVENSFKLALSILWGVYALHLIVFGLWKDLKYIRIAAMVLFGVTLVKLFLYDMEDMSTISKTIVMIILGTLLLTASFLYNKSKRTPAHEKE